MPDQHPSESLDERSRWSLWLVLAVIVLAACVIYRLDLIPHIPEEPPPPLAIDRPLTALDLQAFIGAERPFTLKDLQGHVTLINFWATWCGPCRQEFPHLIEMTKRFGSESDFRLISIVSGVQAGKDLEESREQTAAFLRKMKADFPVYVDAKGDSHRAVLELLASLSPGGDPSAIGFSLPTTLLVDRNGLVRNLWVGFAPQVPEEVERSVSRLLEEKQTVAGGE